MRGIRVSTPPPRPVLHVHVHARFRCLHACNAYMSALCQFPEFTSACGIRMRTWLTTSLVRGCGAPGRCIRIP
jgi:hypothetical protein